MNTEVNWKRVVWIALAFLIIYACPTEGQEKAAEKKWECKLSMVHWIDAVVYTRQPLAEDIDTMLANVVAIGCVKQTEKTVLVIQNITEGTPDIFMVIPKSWVVKIIPLTIKEEEKPKESNGGKKTKPSSSPAP